MEESYETFEEELWPPRAEPLPQKPVRQIRRPGGDIQTPNLRRLCIYSLMLCKSFKSIIYISVNTCGQQRNEQLKYDSL